MRLLWRYLMIAVFGAVLLAGVQVPNFADQYTKRVGAQLAQAQLDLAGFRVVAQRFFHGSLQALIAAHEASSDPKFRAEAAPLRAMVDRERELQRQQDALKGPLYGRAWFIALHGDRTLIRQTWQVYSPALLLDRTAAAFGAGLAFVACIGLELLAVLLRGSWRMLRPRRYVRI